MSHRDMKEIIERRKRGERIERKERTERKEREREERVDRERQNLSLDAVRLRSFRFSPSEDERLCRLLSANWAVRLIANKISYNRCFIL